MNASNHLPIQTIEIEAGQQRGFTLIETIIAMTLLSLLMAIVWTMFSVYTKLEAKGVAVAGESELVRAIDRQLRRDILHIVAIDKQRSVPLDLGSDPMATEFPQNGYLVGSATELHFVVCTEPESADAEDPIRVISYQPRSMVADSEDQLGVDNDADFALATDGDVQSRMTDEDETPLGIDRHDRCWRKYWEQSTTASRLEDSLSNRGPIALDADDFMQIGATSLDESTSRQGIIQRQDQTDPIPELRRLSFRYYDGQAWISQWDSSIQRRLPWAIEINFDLKMHQDPSSPETDKPTLDRQVDQPLAVDTLGADANSITLGENSQFEDMPLTDYRIVVKVLAASPQRPIDSQLDSTVVQEAF